MQFSILPIAAAVLAAHLGVAWEVQYFSNKNCNGDYDTSQSGSGVDCIAVLMDHAGKTGSVRWHGPRASVWLNSKCTYPADPHGPTTFVKDGQCFGVLSQTYFQTTG